MDVETFCFAYTLIFCKTQTFSLTNLDGTRGVLTNLLLSESDQYPNGEERRLFYVAMTRARERLYLIAGASYKSKFIMEFEYRTAKATDSKCPRCLTADVMVMKTGIAKNGNKYKFYGCANYQYGCNYNKTEWFS